MQHPDWIMSVRDLKHEYFYNPTNKIIYLVIKKIYNQYKESSFDPFLLMSSIKNENVAYEEEIEKSGGIEYLETLKELSEDYTKADLEQQAEIIKTLSYMRDVVDELNRIDRYVQNGEKKSIQDINSFIDDREKKVTNKYTIRDSYSNVGEVIDDTLEELKKNVRDGFVGYPSKIGELNKYMTYRKGELVILGARAKMGKSTFGMNEAHNLAIVKGVPVLYLDTEMQTSTFITRLIALDSGLPIRVIETFEYLKNKKMKAKVEESIKRIKESPLIHKYSPSWSKEKIRDDVLALKRSKGIEFIVYDYIKVKTASDSNLPEHNQLGDLAIFLKDLAGEINLPILTMAQMSPYEMRLADSDKLNRYASVVAFLMPLGNQVRSTLIANGCKDTKDYIYVEYNRNGASMNDPNKGVYVDYTRQNATFRESPYQEGIQNLAR